MNKHVIVLATPHHRYDGIERVLQDNGITVVRLRSKEELVPERLAALAPRYIFFPHWSWKIPAEVFEQHECVIFHMTDLPYGRGGSPLQNLIVRGHRETKLTALRCVSELDAGPVYMKHPLSLLGTAEEIFLHAAQLMAEMIGKIVTNEITPVDQTGVVTTFQRRRPEESNMAGLSELEQAFDFIRMLDAETYPPAFMETEHFRFEFSRASLRPDSILADVRITRKKS